MQTLNGVCTEIFFISSHTLGGDFSAQFKHREANILKGVVYKSRHHFLDFHNEAEGQYKNCKICMDRGHCSDPFHLPQ